MMKQLRRMVLELKNEMTTVVTAKVSQAVVKLSLTDGAFKIMRKKFLAAKETLNWIENGVPGGKRRFCKLHSIDLERRLEE